MKRYILFIALSCYMPILLNAAADQDTERARQLLGGASNTIRIKNDTGKTIYYTYNGLSKPVSMSNQGPTHPLKQGASRNTIQNLAFSMSPISPENPGTPIDLTSIPTALPVIISIAPKLYLGGLAGYDYYPYIDAQKMGGNALSTIGAFFSSGK